MSREHRIATVLDILSLTSEEFGRFLPDLAAWYAFNKAIEQPGVTATGFIWVDDGKPAEIHSVHVTVEGTGEVQAFKGSAWSAPA